MPSVSLCMIVRNEEEVLARCLSSIVDLVDEVIVVDTCSDDRTPAIARQFGARVEPFRWRDDFSAARNFSFSLATSSWILWLDADDVLLSDARERFIALKARLDRDVYYLPYDYAQDETGASVCTLWRERILRRSPAIRWHYPVHECVAITHEMTSERVDVTITHRRTSAGIVADTSRNLRILQRAIRSKAFVGDARLRYYFARELQDAGREREACAAYERYLEMPGGWEEDRICARQRLAACYLRLAAHDPAGAAAHRAAARRVAKEARQADSRWAEPYFVLGNVAFEEGDWREAVFWYEQALRPVPPVMSPVDRHAYRLGPAVQLCLAHDRLGDIARANRYNEVALSMRSDDSGLLYNRGYFRSRLAPLLTESPRLAFTHQRREGWFWCAEPVPPADAPAAPFDHVFPLNAIPADDASLQAIAVETPVAADRVAICAGEWKRVLAPGAEVTLNFRGGTSADDQAVAMALLQAGLVVEYAGRQGESFAARAVAPRAPHRVGFVGSCDLRIPQYRIRIFHIDRWLRSQGWRSEIIEPDGIADCDTLVFYRAYTEEEHARMSHATALGKRVILDLAEDLFDLPEHFPWYRPMVAAADLVVCCSRALAARVQASGMPAVVIEDAVETAFDSWCDYGPRRALTVGWIGVKENAQRAERLRGRIEGAGHRLVTIHDGPEADVPWDLYAWPRALLRCDVAIAPVDTALQPSKSNNKVTTCMALGLPVVASPLDAYVSIIRDGENGLIARTDDDWAAALDRLRDAGTRRRIGEAGLSTARGFALDAIAARWASLLFGAAAAPEVDIIVPTCGNRAYLEACLDSISACTAGVRYRVIVVANGDAAHDLPAVDARTTTVVRSARLSFAEAINVGVAAGDAPYLCLLNDDTIVSRGWLATLLETLRSGASICNPLSNCDRGWTHDYDLAVGGVPLLPGANVLESGQVHAGDGSPARIPVRALWDFAPALTRLLDREWVAFYCTAMPRSVFDAVGPLDDGFVNGAEDVDFCRRARRLGYRAVIDERSFVFHFGGRSRAAPAPAAAQAAREERNQARWSAKWDRPLLAIHAGYAWEPWTPDSLEHGIGGAETAAVHLAESLGRSGWRVVLFGCCPQREGIYGSVEYRDASTFDAFAARHHLDVFVASRWVDLLEKPLKASRRYLWLHDTRAMGTPLGSGDKVRALYPALDGIFCLSPWHREHVMHVHGIPGDRIRVTRNGIDPERFAMHVARQPHRLIYSSSPDRGLDVLLDLFPRIRAELPDAELHVFYGFDNWDKSLAARPDPSQHAWRARVTAAMQQPGVYNRGRIGQRQLAEEMLRSDVWLYPTSFHETYCITALEAQAAGVVCVCSGLAGLMTTVADRGVLLDGDARSPEYQQQAIGAVLDLLRDRPRREALVERARTWALTQTWDGVAAEWNAWFRGDEQTLEVSGAIAHA